MMSENETNKLRQVNRERAIENVAGNTFRNLKEKMKLHTLCGLLKDPEVCGKSSKLPSIVKLKIKLLIQASRAVGVGSP